MSGNSGFDWSLARRLEPAMQKWLDWCAKNGEAPEALSAATTALEAITKAGLIILPATPVGWFNPHNDYHGYQQVAKEFEGQPRHIPLYGDPARIAAAEAHVDEDETA